MDNNEIKFNGLISKYKPGRDLYSIIRKDIELLAWINNKVPSIDNLPAQIYSLMHNIDPICKYGNIKPFFNSWAGFRMCGKKLSCKCWEENHSVKISNTKRSKTKEYWNDIIEKRKITNLKKYGTEFAQQSNVVKDKVEKNNIKKYGVKTTLLVPEVAEKIKDALITRYGVDHPFKDILKKKSNVYLLRKIRSCCLSS